MHVHACVWCLPQGFTPAKYAPHSNIELIYPQPLFILCEIIDVTIDTAIP
jgi:hypothetical protein